LVIQTLDPDRYLAKNAGFGSPDPDQIKNMDPKHCQEVLKRFPYHEFIEAKKPGFFHNGPETSVIEEIKSKTARKEALS
jgi:hypothetical protein